MPSHWYHSQFLSFPFFLSVSSFSPWPLQWCLLALFLDSLSAPKPSLSLFVFSSRVLFLLPTPTPSVAVPCPYTANSFLLPCIPHRPPSKSPVPWPLQFTPAQCLWVPLPHLCLSTPPIFDPCTLVAPQLYKSQSRTIVCSHLPDTPARN